MHTIKFTFPQSMVPNMPTWDSSPEGIRLQKAQLNYLRTKFINDFKNCLDDAGLPMDLFEIDVKFCPDRVEPFIDYGDLNAGNVLEIKTVAYSFASNMTRIHKQISTVMKETSKLVTFCGEFHNQFSQPVTKSAIDGVVKSLSPNYTLGW